MREAAAAIILRDGKVLLGKRAPGRVISPNVWDFIGGHLEAGETHKQTLVRELGEELGIEPTEYRFLETLPEDQPERHGDGRYHFYLVTNWNGTPENLQPHEHIEIRWVPVADLARMELASPLYLRLVADALSR